MCSVIMFIVLLTYNVLNDHQTRWMFTQKLQGNTFFLCLIISNMGSYLISQTYLFQFCLFILFLFVYIILEDTFYTVAIYHYCVCVIPLKDACVCPDLQSLYWYCPIGSDQR